MHWEVTGAYRILGPSPYLVYHFSLPPCFFPFFFSVKPTVVSFLKAQKSICILFSYPCDYKNKTAEIKLGLWLPLGLRGQPVPRKEQVFQKICYSRCNTIFIKNAQQCLPCWILGSVSPFLARGGMFKVQQAILKKDGWLLSLIHKVSVYDD